VFGHTPMVQQEHYDEDTLFKVYDALREDAGLTEKQVRACITAMRNAGILFREKLKPSAPAGPTPRGIELQEAGHVGSSDVNQSAS